jgi:hypothetical protein
MQLAIPISREDDPLFRQVYSGVRQAILSGAAGIGLVMFFVDAIALTLRAHWYPTYRIQQSGSCWLLEHLL